MRSYGLFYLAALCTLAQIAAALLVERPTTWAAAVGALCCGLLGLLFIFWPMAATMKNGRLYQGAGISVGDEPVTQGPYAVVRHPHYLGYILVNLTFMLSNPYWPGILFGLAAVLCFYAYARQEEKRLRTAYGAAYGAAYEDYMRRVPSFNAPLGVLRLLRQ